MWNWSKNQATTLAKTTPSRHTGENQNYYEIETMNLTNKYNMNAGGKVDNEFVKEQAEETLPLGPLAGGKPGIDPDDGTTEDLGVVAPAGPAPSDCGAGDGAYVESLVTDDGGAIRGGNCWGPASFPNVTNKSEKKIMRHYRIVQGNEIVTTDVII